MSLTTFVANNPWDGNQPAEFSLGEYRVSLPNGGYPGRSMVWGIRAKTETRERLMPDSLAELWKTGKVQPEALPGLLAAIQPAVIQDDYKPVLRLTWPTEIAVPAAGMGIVTSLLLGAAVRCGKQTVILPSLLAGIAAALVIAGMLWELLRLRKSRRKQQMTWMLAWSAGNGRVIVDGANRARRTFWLHVAAVMFGLVLAIMGGIFTGATLYDRYCGNF